MHQDQGFNMKIVVEGFIIITIRGGNNHCYRAIVARLYRRGTGEGRNAWASHHTGWIFGLENEGFVTRWMVRIVSNVLLTEAIV